MSASRRGDIVTDEVATLLAAKLKTPLQIGQHLVRAFEAGFEIGAKPIVSFRPPVRVAICFTGGASGAAFCLLLRPS